MFKIAPLETVVLLYVLLTGYILYYLYLLDFQLLLLDAIRTLATSTSNFLLKFHFNVLCLLEICLNKYNQAVRNGLIFTFSRLFSVLLSKIKDSSNNRIPGCRFQQRLGFLKELWLKIHSRLDHNCLFFLSKSH